MDNSHQEKYSIPPDYPNYENSRIMPRGASLQGLQVTHKLPALLFRQF